MTDRYDAFLDTEEPKDRYDAFLDADYLPPNRTLPQPVAKAKTPAAPPTQEGFQPSPLETQQVYSPEAIPSFTGVDTVDKRPAAPELRAAPAPSFVDRLFPSKDKMPGSQIASAQIRQEAHKAGLAKEDYIAKVNPKSIPLKRVERFLDGVGSGAAGTIGSMLGTVDWLADSDIARDLSNKTREWVIEKAPESPDFSDALASGIGSAGVFFIPGIGVAKGTAQLAMVAPNMAKWAGVAVSTALESMTEAGSTYSEVLRATGSEEKASIAATGVFIANIPLIAVTNKLGVFADKGGKIKRAVTSALLEGIQETGQEAIGAGVAGREIKGEDLWTAGGVGAITGGGMGALSGIAMSQPTEPTVTGTPGALPPATTTGVPKPVDRFPFLTEPATMAPLTGTKPLVAPQVATQRMPVKPEAAQTTFGGVGDTGGYAENPIIVEMPEMVELAQSLMGGKTPLIKEKLRLMKGQAVGSFHPRGEGEIAIKADLFENPQQASKTMAHEIGHLVDWLDDKTLSRGNVLGHVAALKKHLKHSLDDIPPLQKKEILAEMQAASYAWKPIPEDAPTKYIKYRNKPAELYADVYSMFLNDPKALQAIAPKTMAAIMDYMHKRPTVQDRYEYIQELIASGEPAVAENRHNRTREMFAKGEELAAQELQKEPITLTKLKTFFADQFSPVLDKMALAKKQGVEISAKDNPEYAYDDMLFTLSEHRAWLRPYEAIVKQLESSGVSWEDLGEYLFHQRVINERGKLANPLGFNPDTSTKQLTYLKDKVGADNYALLESSAVKFYENQEYVINRLREAGMIGDDFLDSPAYATFDVLKYYEDKFGPELSAQAYVAPSISAKIYKQIGTLSAIRNPATATLAKGLSQLSAATRKIAAKKTIQFFQHNFPEEVAPADKRFNGNSRVPVPPKDPRLGMILYPDKGPDGNIQMKGYYVSKDIAAAFNGNPREGAGVIGALNYVTQQFSAANNVWRNIFVGYNPKFWTFNFFRDLHRTVRNVPGASYANIINNYSKSMPSAVKRGFGIEDDFITKLERDKILPTVSYFYGHGAEDKQMERLLKKYSLHEKAWHSNITKPIQVFFSALEKMKAIGEVIETLPKAAAYKHLVEKYPDMPKEEVAHWVRNYAGTPNVKRGGDLKQITNNVFLFSNIATQGYRTDLKVLKERPGTFAYKMGQQLLPKFVMLAATLGLLGKAAKDMIGDSSDYDNTNYNIIPLGTTESGKTVILRIPLDETARTFGGIFWKLATLQKPEELLSVLDYTAGQFPGLTPTLSIPYDVIQYATGKNPYNSYYGDTVIPQQVFEAGGAESAEAFMKHVWGSAGGNIFYKFKGNDVEQIQSELEKLLNTPIVGNIVGSWIKVTDRGQADSIRRKVATVRQERAKASLKVKDKIIEHINATESVDEASVVGLYRELRDSDQYKGSRAAFMQKYITAFKFKTNQPLMNALLSARSTEERETVEAEMEKKGMKIPRGSAGSKLIELMKATP